MYNRLLPIVSLLVFTTLFFYQCVPAKQEEITDINLDTKDAIYRKIYGFQDQLLTDSLLSYYQHRDPAYRYAVANAMASLKDEKAIPALTTLLSDKIPEVRIAAAYALGQIGQPQAQEALVNAFVNDTLSTSQAFKRTILEAIGKSASKKYLPALSSVKTYTAQDTLALEGQALAMYRYGIKGISSEEGTARIIQMLENPNYPLSVKQIAANYLYRTPNLQLDSLAAPIAQIIRQETHPNILAPLVIAAGKTKSPQALEAIKHAYQHSDDYRVKVNALRAFGNFNYADTKEIILAAIDNRDKNVAQTASQVLIDHGYTRDASGYYKMAKNKTDLPWIVKTNLLAAALKHTPPNYGNSISAISNYIKAGIESEEGNEYEKAALLRALAGFPWNYKYIYKQGFNNNNLIIRGAAVDALQKISTREDFDAYFGASRRKVKADLAQYFKEAIEKGDVAMSYYAAQGLQSNTIDFQEYLDTLSFIETAIQKLKIPQEIETKYELQKARAHLSGNAAPTLAPPTFNHPIDWNLIDGINSDAKAEIYTSKGTITLDLFLKHAPGTVANFVQLARNNFFDNKNFHRVIPNFVAQGGCPRGDGFGALDFTIRSELGASYQYDEEGYVGMASAGNHTECTQWFITHAPTPHLNGNYTIFGKVSDGMDIVHQLEIGDRISDIRILN